MFLAMKSYCAKYLGLSFLIFPAVLYREKRFTPIDVWLIQSEIQFSRLSQFHALELLYQLTNNNYKKQRRKKN